MNKKKKMILSVVLLIAIVVMGFLYYQNFIRVRNVFDQMYYTRIRNNYDWFTGGRATLFDNMKQLRNISRDEELAATQDGRFKEYYKDEYLKKNQGISLTFSKERKAIAFYFKWEFPETDERIWISYIYKVDTKELLKESPEIASPQCKNDLGLSEDRDEISDFLARHNLTWEEIDKLYNWFLYDKILVDWFEVNTMRFSLKNLGKYTSIDNTVRK